MARQKIRTIVLICIILIISIFMLFFQKRANGKIAKISVNGTVIETLDLNKDCVYTLDNNYGMNQIQVLNGTVSVLDADCRNHVCVKTHGISKQGEVISCMPHMLVISIQDSTQEVDSIAY